MRRLSSRHASLVFSVGLAAVLAAGGAGAAVTVEQLPDGTVRMGNDLVAFEAANQVGTTMGLRRVVLKALGHNMAVAALPAELGGPGFLAAEVWDPVELPGATPGAPDCGNLLAPVASGATPDGAAAVLVQEAAGPVVYRRTVIVREGFAGIEVRWDVENRTAAPTAWALRSKAILSPGARGPGAELKDDVFVPTTNGVLAIDQTMPRGQQTGRYGGTVYAALEWDGQPAREWTGAAPKTPRLAGHWAVRVNRQYGDGLAFLPDPANTVAWNIHPSVTIEPSFRAQALGRGERWSSWIVIVPFTGAKDKTVAKATPLYLETSAVRLDGGMLVGEIVPFFTGTLRVESGLEKAGDYPVTANTPFRFDRQPAVRDAAHWRLVALGTGGKVIGHVDQDRQCALTPAVLDAKPVVKPEATGDLYAPEADAARIAEFVARPDFVVHVAWEASDIEKELAHRIARLLGVGVAYRNPAGKVLAIGTPAANAFVRNAGVLRNSVDDAWPGAGKGAILRYDSLELTEKPAVLVCGSDREGAQRAARAFLERFAAGRPEPKGFAFWAVGADQYIYPWSRPEMHTRLPALRLEAARGEYEDAQAVITARGDLRDVEVTVEDLRHAQTGEPMKTGPRDYRTPYRWRRGPLWLRWVDYAPFPREGGWCGNPDPLFEKPETEIEAGRSQALWLTAVVPDTATPGLYTGRIVCRAGGEEQAIPIELTVWDFTLPLTGVPGHPYMRASVFAPDDRRIMEDHHIQALVQNLVEHGQRWISLNEGLELIRPHLSAEGIYKGVSLPWMETNDDGTLALDFSGWDRFVRVADKAAEPYGVSYMAYGTIFPFSLTRDFAKACPDRFKDRPEPPTPLHDYEVEVLSLFKRHLEKQGLLPDRFLIKLGDEPLSLRKWYQTLCRAADEVGLPFTTAMNQFPIDEAEELLKTNIGMWEPLYLAFKPEFMAKARAAGQRVAWYNCGPPPHIGVTTPAPEIRAYVWQAAKYELDAVARWGIQCWEGGHANAWQEYRQHHNQVVYPEHPVKKGWLKQGKGWVDKAPVDSIRWEHLRDGMEDSAYVKALREAIAAARAAGRAAEADKGQAVLDEVWTNLFPDMNHYQPPYDELMAARRRIAGAIVALGAQRQDGKE